MKKTLLFSGGAVLMLCIFAFKNIMYQYQPGDQASDFKLKETPQALGTITFIFKLQ